MGLAREAGTGEEEAGEEGTLMSKHVTLTRSKGGGPWQPYASVDLYDGSTWPPDLPDDVANLLRQRLISNHHFNSTDGHYYRIEEAPKVIEPVTP
jgi:hypothetical protein